MRKRDEEKGKYFFIHKHTRIVNSIVKLYFNAKMVFRMDTSLQFCWLPFPEIIQRYRSDKVKFHLLSYELNISWPEGSFTITLLTHTLNLRRGF